MRFLYSIVLCSTIIATSAFADVLTAADPIAINFGIPDNVFPDPAGSDGFWIVNSQNDADGKTQFKLSDKNGNGTILKTTSNSSIQGFCTKPKSILVSQTQSKVYIFGETDSGNAGIFITNTSGGVSDDKQNMIINGLSSSAAIDTTKNQIWTIGCSSVGAPSDASYLIKISISTVDGTIELDRNFQYLSSSLSVDQMAFANIGGSDRIYFLEGSTVRKVTLDTSGQIIENVSLYTAGTSISGCTVDGTSQTLYFTNPANGSIISIQLDDNGNKKSDPVETGNLGLNAPYRLSFDNVNKIYVLNKGKNSGDPAFVVPLNIQRGQFTGLSGFMADFAEKNFSSYKTMEQADMLCSAENLSYSTLQLISQISMEETRYGTTNKNLKNEFNHPELTAIEGTFEKNLPINDKRNPSKPKDLIGAISSNIKKMRHEFNNIVIWAQPFVQYMNMKDNSDFVGCRNLVKGSSFGVHSFVKPNFIVGAVIGAAQSKIKVKEDLGESNVKNFHGGLYAAYKFKDFIVDGAFLFGKSKFNNTRNSTDADDNTITSKEEHNSSNLGLFATLTGKLKATYIDTSPYVTVGVRSKNVSDGYKESGGAASQNIKVDGFKMTFLTTEVGSRFSMPITNNGNGFQPFAKLAWLRESPSKKNIKVSSESYGASTEITSPQKSVNMLSTGIGFMFHQNSNLKFSLTANGKFGKSQRIGECFIKADYSF